MGRLDFVAPPFQDPEPTPSNTSKMRWFRSIIFGDSALSKPLNGIPISTVGTENELNKRSTSFNEASRLTSRLILPPPPSYESVVAPTYRHVEHKLKEESSPVLPTQTTPSLPSKSALVDRPGLQGSLYRGANLKPVGNALAKSFSINVQVLPSSLAAFSAGLTGLKPQNPISEFPLVQTLSRENLLNPFRALEQAHLSDRGNTQIIIFIMTHETIGCNPRAYPMNLWARFSASPGSSNAKQSTTGYIHSASSAGGSNGSKSSSFAGSSAGQGEPDWDSWLHDQGEFQPDQGSTLESVHSEDFETLKKHALFLSLAQELGYRILPPDGYGPSRGPAVQLVGAPLPSIVPLDVRITPTRSPESLWASNFGGNDNVLSGAQGFGSFGSVPSQQESNLCDGSLNAMPGQLETLPFVLSQPNASIRSLGGTAAPIWLDRRLEKVAGVEKYFNPSYAPGKDYSCSYEPLMSNPVRHGTEVQVSHSQVQQTLQGADKEQNFFVDATGHRMPELAQDENIEVQEFSQIEPTEHNSMFKPSSSTKNRPVIKIPCSFDGCNKSFRRPHLYADHIHNHHHQGEPAHPCSYPGCRRTFTLQTNMRRHYKNKHIKRVADAEDETRAAAQLSTI